MLGYPKDELMNLHLYNFFAKPEQAEQINSLLRTDGNVEDIEVELINRNRELLQSIISLSMEMDADDNLYVQE